MSSKDSGKYFGVNCIESDPKELMEKKRFLNLLNEVKFKDIIDLAPLLNFMEDLCVNWKTGFKDDKEIIEKFTEECQQEKTQIMEYKKSNANLKKQISKYKRQKARVEDKAAKLEIKCKFAEYQRLQKIIAPHKLSLHKKYLKEMNQIYRRCVTKSGNKDFYTSED
ncbi:unnamed protein product [Moneuplotes crassus]|uniref:Uncharacterized protein n=1 Tax=Euplotes crassus TaxID=5936 RepID=A0AAD2D654_EUPCR|nr:unnamed protein product [Moneuplotes crassus]